jgi:hypothetical protein
VGYIFGLLKVIHMKKRYLLLIVFLSLLTISLLLPNLSEAYGFSADATNSALGVLVLLQIIVIAFLGYFQWRAETAEMSAD